MNAMETENEVSEPLSEVVRLKLMDVAMKFATDSDHFMRTYYELYQKAHKLKYGYLNEVPFRHHRATAERPEQNTFVGQAQAHPCCDKFDLDKQTSHT